jgi:diguanylate cyclase (GGDEF)-like protein/PAS domain S-box-containing protein
MHELLRDAASHPASDETDARFQLLIDSIEDYAIYMLDCAGHVLTWNLGAELNKGYKKQEIVGRNFRMFFVPEDIAGGVPQRELAQAASVGRSTGEGWRLRKNGERFWASFVLTAMLDTQGKLVGFAKVVRDLTDRKRQEDGMFAMAMALRDERDRMHAAAESSMDALFICEAVREAGGAIEDFIFTYLNSNVEQLTGTPREALMGRRLSGFRLVQDEEGLLAKFRQVVELGEPFVGEIPTHRLDGKSAEASGKWLRIQVVRLRDGVAVTAADITLRKQYEERLQQLAEKDALTGLLNRSVLQGRLDAALDRAHQDQHYVGIFLLDLDCFKAVNDTWGHAAGDEVLQAVALRLKASLRREDMVIRIGGDEFVVILPGMQQLPLLLTLARRILDGFARPVQCTHGEIAISCSLGMTVSQGGADQAGKALRRADMAMYAAKARGKNSLEMDEELQAAMLCTATSQVCRAGNDANGDEIDQEATRGAENLKN